MWATYAVWLLGAVWIVSAAAKLRAFNAFVADLRVSRLASSYVVAKQFAVSVVIIEFLTGALSFCPGQPRHVAALISLGLIVAFTGSFVIRAAKSTTLHCACFGRQGRWGRREPGPGSYPVAWRDVVLDTTTSARIAARNALFAALVGIALPSPSLTLFGVTAVVVLMMVAAVVHVVIPTRHRAQRPHPLLPSLRPRRRHLFATDWYTGVYNPWVMCRR